VRSSLTHPSTRASNSGSYPRSLHLRSASCTAHAPARGRSRIANGPSTSTDARRSRSARVAIGRRRPIRERFPECRVSSQRSHRRARRTWRSAGTLTTLQKSSPNTQHQVRFGCEAQRSEPCQRAQTYACAPPKQTDSRRRGPTGSAGVDLLETLMAQSPSPWAQLRARGRRRSYRWF